MARLVGSGMFATAAVAVGLFPRCQMRKSRPSTSPSPSALPADLSAAVPVAPKPIFQIARSRPSTTPSLLKSADSTGAETSIEPTAPAKFVGEFTPATRFCTPEGDWSVSELTPFFGSALPANVIVSMPSAKLMVMLAALGLKKFAGSGVKSGATPPASVAKPVSYTHLTLPTILLV